MDLDVESRPSPGQDAQEASSTPDSGTALALSPSSPAVGLNPAPAFDPATIKIEAPQGAALATVPIALIDEDFCRSLTDRYVRDHIASFMEHVQEAKSYPALQLIRKADGRYSIVDGHIRRYGLEQLGCTFVGAIVTVGTAFDALCGFLRLNKDHHVLVVPRATKEAVIVRAVRLYQAETGMFPSTRMLQGAIGIKKSTIGGILKRHGIELKEDELTMGLDGKVRRRGRRTASGKHKTASVKSATVTTLAALPGGRGLAPIAPGPDGSSGTPSPDSVEPDQLDGSGQSDGQERSAPHAEDLADEDVRTLTSFIIRAFALLNDNGKGAVIDALLAETTPVTAGALTRKLRTLHEAGLLRLGPKHYSKHDLEIKGFGWLVLGLGLSWNRPKRSKGDQAHSKAEPAGASISGDLR